jgi:hypothetical protein
LLGCIYVVLRGSNDVLLPTDLLTNNRLGAHKLPSLHQRAAPAGGARGMTLLQHDVASLLEAITDKGFSGPANVELSQLKALMRKNGGELVPVAFSVLLDRLQANNAKVGSGSSSLPRSRAGRYPRPLPLHALVCARAHTPRLTRHHRAPPRRRGC